MRDFLINGETRLYAAHGQRVRIQFFTDPQPLEPWEDDGSTPMYVAHGRGNRLNYEPARGFYPERGKGWQFVTEYADAIGEALSDAEFIAKAAADEAAGIFTAAMLEARPDLAPQWMESAQ